MFANITYNCATSRCVKNITVVQKYIQQVDQPLQLVWNIVFKWHQKNIDLFINLFINLLRTHLPNLLI